MGKTVITFVESIGMYEAKVPYIYTDDYGNTGTFYRREILTKAQVEQKRIETQTLLSDLADQATQISTIEAQKL